MILPCELFGARAARLRGWSCNCEGVEVAGRVHRVGRYECVWLNNLVDCIVTALPDHPLVASEL